MSQIHGGLVLLSLMTAGLLCVVFVVVAMWKNEKNRASQHRASLEALEQQCAEFQDKNKHIHKRVQETALALSETQKELAGHKKKKFLLSKELETLKNTLEEVRQSLKHESMRCRALQVALDASKQEQAQQQTQIQPIEAPRPTSAIQEHEETARLRQECAHLEETKTRLNDYNTKLQETVRRQKEDLERMQRKIRDFGRIEVLNKNKSALLEDKMKSLQRQHYEAISTLVALRGEVILPPSMLDKEPRWVTSRPRAQG